MPDCCDKFWCFAVLGGVGVTEVGKDCASAGCKIEKSRTCKVGREQDDNDTSCRILAWAFLFFVEKHAEQCGKECGLHMGDLLER